MDHSTDIVGAEDDAAPHLPLYAKIDILDSGGSAGNMSGNPLFQLNAGVTPLLGTGETDANHPYCGRPPEYIAPASREYP